LGGGEKKGLLKRKLDARHDARIVLGEPEKKSALKIGKWRMLYTTWREKEKTSPEERGENRTNRIFSLKKKALKDLKKERRRRNYEIGEKRTVNAWKKRKKV